MIWERCILHADFDAFYASVEQLDNPKLLGKPVLVGGRPDGRGVVASCSYEARESGIHSAMPMSVALKLNSNAIVLQPRFERYKEVSEKVMSIFKSVTDIFQPMSLDEAYLDISHIIQGGLDPRSIGVDLKTRVKENLGVNISVGIGVSKSISKIACDIGKPDGLVVVDPGKERLFIAPLHVKVLPGIGPKMVSLLLDEKIETLDRLSKQTYKWAEKRFGKRGPLILDMSRGIDNREVENSSTIKSISSESTFHVDTHNVHLLSLQIRKLSKDVVKRLRTENLKARTVTVRIRLSDFTTFTRSKTLMSPIEDERSVIDIAWKLFYEELLPARRFRLLGIRLSNFSDVSQLALF